MVNPPPRRDLSSKIPLTHPLVVHLEVTNQCNFGCKYCPESLEDFNSRVGGARSMNEKEFRHIANEIRNLGKVSVLRMWIMGEPLLNKNIYEFIKIAKDEQNSIADQVEVTTNGSMLTISNIEKLLDSRIDIVKISIYGIGNRHHEITSSNVKSETIFQNVKNLFNRRNETKSNVKIFIKMVDPFDSNELELFKERYSPLADQIDVYSPHSWIEDHAIQNYESKFKDKSIYQIRKNLLPKKVCGFPFYTVSIHANGDVSVCCVDWEKKTKIGNLHSETLESIWRGKLIRNIQKKHLLGLRSELPGCSTCNYFYDNCSENLDEKADTILKRLEEDFAKKI